MITLRRLLIPSMLGVSIVAQSHPALAQDQDQSVLLMLPADAQTPALVTAVQMELGSRGLDVIFAEDSGEASPAARLNEAQSNAHRYKLLATAWLDPAGGGPPTLMVIGADDRFARQAPLPTFLSEFDPRSFALTLASLLDEREGLPQVHVHVRVEVAPPSYASEPPLIIIAPAISSGEDGATLAPPRFADTSTEAPSHRSSRDGFAFRFTPTYAVVALGAGLSLSYYPTRRFRLELESTQVAVTDGSDWSHAMTLVLGIVGMSAPDRRWRLEYGLQIGTFGTNGNGWEFGGLVSARFAALWEISSRVAFGPALGLGVAWMTGDGGIPFGLVGPSIEVSL